MRFSVRLRRATSAYIFRQATRNGAAPPPTGFWRLPWIAHERVAGVLLISISPLCARRPKSAHIETPFAPGSLKLPACRSVGSVLRRQPASGSASPVDVKAWQPLRPRRCGCRGDRMIDETLTAGARRVLDQSRAQRLRIATAESCTGGLVISALTDIAGS